MAAASFWKNRRVLVTGGAGFIGFALSKKLYESGARVTVLDIKKGLPDFATPSLKNGIVFVRGSVASKKDVERLFKKGKFQTIFHLAAEAIVDRSLADPATTLETNIRGTWTVIEAARHMRDIPEIVVASSDKAYGTSKVLPYTEKTPLAGEVPYDVSKSATDLIAHMYAKTYKLPIVITRCGNVYGPGDLNWSRLMPDAFRSIALGKKLKLRSNGSFSRDYIFIDDAVNAYMTLAENVRKVKAGEAFNFGTQVPITVLEALQRVEKAAGKKLDLVVLNSAKFEIIEQYLDATKARKLLKWRETVSRDEGFKKTFKWYDWYLKEH